MKVSRIVAHLRKYCPSFSGRIAVGLDFSPDRSQVKLAIPSAVVFPDGDEASPSIARESIVQDVEDTFSVVLILKTQDALRGEATADHLHLLRAELFRALLGWIPDEGYDPIEYVGGEVTEMDRSLTYYVMRFTSSFVVGHAAGTSEDRPPETWQEYELAGLPELKAMDIAVDVIDPIFDPNLANTGPDGRVEFKQTQENLSEAD
jgi:hypothetical protein